MNRIALRRAAVSVAAALALSACGATVERVGSAGRPEPVGQPGPTASTAFAPGDSPPPVTLRFDGRSLDVAPFTYCWQHASRGLCADGMPPAELPDVGRPSRITLSFPVPGWLFTATFKPAGQPCGRSQTVELDPRDHGTAEMTPAGYAGAYDVILFGRGPGGDLAATFRWTTPADGPRPAPTARLALLADHDGKVDSYGVELAVDHLAANPADATAAVTVTAADGRSLTFDATPAAEGCRPEGSLYWDGPDDQGRAAASLGAAPFTYRVVLTLDGARHEATAGWPAGEIEGNEPSVALKFSPALPGLR